MKFSTATNDNYVWPLLVMASSLHKQISSTSDLTIGYISGRLSTKNRLLIETVLSELQLKHFFLEFDGSELPLSRTPHVTQETFVKFLIADCLCDSHVWVDVDTVILRPRLLENLAQDLDSNSIAMVKHEAMVPAVKIEASMDSRMTFNAGIVQWGPSTNRRDWRAYLSSSKEPLLFEDQEVFNILYQRNIVELKGVLNANLVGGNFLVDAIIGHYPGNHKPWHLHENSRQFCTRAQCGFSHWFQAESDLLAKLLNVTPVLMGQVSVARRISSLGQSSRLKLLAKAADYGFGKLFALFLNNVHPFMHLRRPEK